MPAALLLISFAVVRQEHVLVHQALDENQFEFQLGQGPSVEKLFRIPVMWNLAVGLETSPMEMAASDRGNCDSTGVVSPL